jgi:hypothetical protein
MLSRKLWADADVAVVSREADAARMNAAFAIAAPSFIEKTPL